MINWWHNCLNNWLETRGRRTLKCAGPLEIYLTSKLPTSNTLNVKTKLSNSSPQEKENWKTSLFTTMDAEWTHFFVLDSCVVQCKLIPSHPTRGFFISSFAAKWMMMITHNKMEIHFLLKVLKFRHLLYFWLTVYQNNSNFFQFSNNREMGKKTSNSSFRHFLVYFPLS
jgi:hypothetical protein